MSGPLSRTLADWFSHWDWTDDVDEEEGQAVVKEVAALEAENAALKELMMVVRSGLLRQAHALRAYDLGERRGRTYDAAPDKEKR